MKSGSNDQRRYNNSFILEKNSLFDVNLFSRTFHEETVEDRRNSGWGKLSEITGILSELPQARKVEVGLKLREVKI